MKVIVVGCGRFGTELAYRLFKRGHDLAVIDKSYDAFNSLPPDFQGRLCEGDALSQDLLHRAGIENADALVAATGSDSVNLAVGHIARTIYMVPNVVARNYEPKSRPLYETFNLQVVSAASWGAKRVEEMLYQAGVRPVFSAGNGEVEIYEITISEEWKDRKISDMTDGTICNLIALTRGGRAFVPEKDTTLALGDVVHLAGTTEAIEIVRNKMCLPREEK